MMREVEESEVITFDASGTIFKTKAITLKSSIHLSNLIKFSKEGEVIFIDEDPKLFRYILNYLRDERNPFPSEYVHLLEKYEIPIGFAVKSKVYVKCYGMSCDNVIITRSTNPISYFCSLCDWKCDVPKCNNARVRKQYHRETHLGCTRRGCRSIRMRNNDRCSGHTKIVKEEDQRILVTYCPYVNIFNRGCNSPIYDKCKYCPDHRCQIDACDNPVKNNQEYCTDHI